MIRIYRIGWNKETKQYAVLPGGPWDSLLDARAAVVPGESFEAVELPEGEPWDIEKHRENRGFIVNERGNDLYRDWDADRLMPRAENGQRCGHERYFYDFETLTPANGWEQYDTDQDAWYYGVWVNLEERRTFSYCEGDRSLVICPTVESFRAELAAMEKFHGAPPPMAKVINDDGSVVECFGTRPSLDAGETFTMKDVLEIVLEKAKEQP